VVRITKPIQPVRNIVVKSVADQKILSQTKSGMQNEGESVKRKKVKPVSEKGKIIKEVDDLFRAYLKRKHGSVCYFCGREQYNISAFHILPKGEYPRLRFSEHNVLLACWSPQYYIKCCHNVFHNALKDNPKYQRIEAKIREHVGCEDYTTYLKSLEKAMPKLTELELMKYKEAYK
jgi:hypothetical protein